MSECVHDFEIGSRYCVHCGQGAAELLYHAKARISLLEAWKDKAFQVYPHIAKDIEHLLQEDKPQ